MTEELRFDCQHREIIFSVQSTHTASGNHPASIQWVHGLLSQGLKSAAIPPFPHMPSWNAEEQLSIMQYTFPTPGHKNTRYSMLFYRETTLRSSSEKTVNPDRVSWPSTLTGQRDLDWGNDSKGHISVEASGEDTGEVSQCTTRLFTKLCTFDDCCLVGYDTMRQSSNWLLSIIFQHPPTQVHCLPSFCPPTSYILQPPSPPQNDILLT
jgi:hypothetical protein